MGISLVALRSMMLLLLLLLLLLLIDLASVVCGLWPVGLDGRFLLLVDEFNCQLSDRLGASCRSDPTGLLRVRAFALIP